MVVRRSSLASSEQGLSLAEALLVVLILGVLVKLAFPSMARLADHQKLRGAADNLRGDLNLARSEAIKRRTHVYVAFSTGLNWCYAVSTGSPCGCGVACGSPDYLIRQSQSSETAAGVELLSASFAGTFCGGQECVRFEALQGNAKGSNGTVIFQAAEGSKLKVIVSALGRVRTCRDSGDPGGWVPEC